jgi:hypothetical protein
MCSYCGCEAEPVIESLMADHAWIAARVRAIRQALEHRDSDSLGWLVRELAETFVRHTTLEEEGLFSQLRSAVKPSRRSTAWSPNIGVWPMRCGPEQHPIRIDCAELSSL